MLIDNLNEHKTLQCEQHIFYNPFRSTGDEMVKINWVVLFIDISWYKRKLDYKSKFSPF